MKIKNKILVFFYVILILNLTIKNLYADIPIYKLNAIKLNYKDNNKIIVAEGEARAKDQFGNEIHSDFIIYDKANNIIKTRSNSKYLDTKGNKILANFFFYDLKLKKISAIDNVKYEDAEGNEYFFSKFEYYENSEKGFGENLISRMVDKSSLESKYAELDNKKGLLILNSDLKKKNIFTKLKSLFNNNTQYTTCENKKNFKNIKEQCPDWSISTYKTKHDSTKKMIYHDHAIIKLRNIPVFYTPYFSHPDPTVKRKSGFLPVSTKNFTNLGRTIKTPYFLEINENSDFTFTPIFYQNENSILLAEYREQNKNSILHIDSSYTKGYKKINKKGDDGQDLNRTSGSRNHFFLNYFANYDDLFFKNNDFQIKIQRISQKNYLNVNQINTDLIKQDINTLNNNITINSFENSKKLKISVDVYENLSNDDRNSKYHYKIPSVEYDDYFKIQNQNASLSSLFQGNNFEGDSKNIIQRNKLSSESDPIIIKKIGIANIIKTNFSNINYYNKNINNKKQNVNSDLYTTLAVENSLPLIKLEKNTEQILKPVIFTKFTTGSTKNESNTNKILSSNDLYSMDRLNNIENPETGGSIGYGIHYDFNKKKESDIAYLKTDFAIGQILSETKKNKMPINSSLNQKSSNIVGSFNFFLNKTINEEIYQNFQKNKKEKDTGLKLNYNFNISNDLDKSLKNDINLSYLDSSNDIKLSYYELNEIGSLQNIRGEYSRNFKNNYNLSFGVIKNLELDYTESNFLEANYESDCLKIGLNLSKKFYDSDDLQKSNNLTLFIMLKPFGQPLAPDLSNFINN